MPRLAALRSALGRSRSESSTDAARLLPSPSPGRAALLSLPLLRGRVRVGALSAEVFAHLGGAGAAGATKPGKLPGILDRPQQAVVGLRHAGLKSCPSQWRDHQGDDPPAGSIRAASGICAPLIPGDEQDAAVSVRGRVDDSRNVLAEPG